MTTIICPKILLDQIQSILRDGYDTLDQMSTRYLSMSRAYSAFNAKIRYEFRNYSSYELTATTISTDTYYEILNILALGALVADDDQTARCYIRDFKRSASDESPYLAAYMEAIA